MDIRLHRKSLKAAGFQGALSVAALGLLFLTGPARSDDLYTMAPPIQADSSAQNYDNSYDNAQADVSADSVFNWSEVPQNQQVPIRRAVFDRGGYQLDDNAGETIVVPFANQNLYVMRFAVSGDGSTYFVNDGNAPTLYVPRDGYLENAAVPGARWYPFSEEFHPSHPVFLGCAPSWTAFVDMGWYPDMHCYGGYYGRDSFLSGGIFLPSFGLFFEIGGHHYDGWDHYREYSEYHPAPYHVTVVNNYYYQRANHPEWGGRPFEGGGDRSGGYHSNNGYRSGGTNSFGQGRVYGGGRSFGGGSDQGYAHRTFSGSVHTFQGGASSFPSGTHTSQTGRPFGGGQTDQGGRTFSGGQGSTSGRTFGGGRASENTRSFSGGSQPAFSGGRTYSNSSSSSQPFGGGRTTSGEGAFGGSRPAFSGGSRSYSSTDSRPAFSGGGRSFGGGSQSRSMSSGSRPSSSNTSRSTNSSGSSNDRSFGGSGDRRR